MRIITYSHHCKNEDWNLDKVQEVTALLRNIEFTIYRGCTSPLREVICDGLICKGWSSKIKISLSSQISITAMKGDFALCLQTGNMGRFYADLLKLEYIYRKRNVLGSIYILPSKVTATAIGSNLVNYERFVEELKLYSEIITVPMFVIGIC